MAAAPPTNLDDAPDVGEVGRRVDAQHHTHHLRVHGRVQLDAEQQQTSTTYHRCHCARATDHFLK